MTAASDSQEARASVQTFGRPLSVRDFECAAIQEVVAGIVILGDTERRIRSLSRAPTGVGLHRFVGHRFAELVAPSQRPLVEHALGRVLAGKPMIELEVLDASTQRWHCVRIAGYRDGGEVAGFVAHWLDIDDAKRGEVERSILRARLRSYGTEVGDAQEPDVQRRFDLMADALPVLIAYVDKERCYQFNNASYERWFGTSREELRGRTLEQVLGVAAYALIRPYVDAALEGRAVTFEMAIPYKDAGVRRVVANYVPDVASSGEIQGFFALIDDVTARREAEAALRQREDEMRQLQKMEALGRLAGGMAHEFNNLLQTVIVGCSAVLASVDEGSAAGQQVSRVRRAAQRGSSLTRQLLTFSRSRDAPATPLDLDALLGDMALLLEHLLGSKVKVEVDLGAHGEIMADAGQIQQVVMNLAINARDAMPDGGRLRLSTSRVDGPHRAPKGWVRLEVSDTGTGMDETTRARIFDPFFTTKPSGAGTGLGLSTVYGIVQKLGGRISVDSEPGVGTTFRLDFRLASPGA